MKKYFAMAGIIVILCFTAVCSNAQSCPNASIQIPNNYCGRGDASSPYKANLEITRFDVTKDAHGHLILKVNINNKGNQDAWETKLVLLLPVNICNTLVSDMRITNIPSTPTTSTQHGGKIEFCIGQLMKGKDFSVTIQVDMSTGYGKGKETLAGFVYNSIPDDCPLNNYRVWVNDGVLCKDLNPATLVEKGSIH